MVVQMTPDTGAGRVLRPQASRAETLDFEVGELREFNRCHDPKTGEFSSSCAVYFTPEQVKTTGGGVHAVRHVAGEGYSQHEFNSSPFTPQDVEDLPGRALYHVTSNLEAVLQSGRLLARPDIDGTAGLGGGQYAAVSMTNDAASARNIAVVLHTAQQLARGADWRKTMVAWAKQDAKTPEQLGILIQQINVEFAGIENRMRDRSRLAPSMTKEQYRQDVTRRAFRTYLIHRDLAGIGKDPILMANWDKLAKAGTVGVVALSQRAHKDLANHMVVSQGKDAFQGEVEVHGDVPVGRAFTVKAADLLKPTKKRS